MTELTLIQRIHLALVHRDLDPKIRDLLFEAAEVARNQRADAQALIELGSELERLRSLASAARDFINEDAHYRLHAADSAGLDRQRVLDAHERLTALVEDLDAQP